MAQHSAHEALYQLESSQHYRCNTKLQRASSRLGLGGMGFPLRGKTFRQGRKEGGALRPSSQSG